MPNTLLHADVTRSIIAAFRATYNALGPWLPEHVYASALERELLDRGHRVATEVAAPVMYKGTLLTRLRMDLVVDGCVVVEVKAGDRLDPNARRQLRAYLSVTPFEVGLLLHYGPEPEFHRVVHTNEWRKPDEGGEPTRPEPPTAAPSPAAAPP